MFRCLAGGAARYVDVAAVVETSDRAQLPQDAVDYFPVKPSSIVEKPGNSSRVGQITS